MCLFSPLWWHLLLTVAGTLFILHSTSLLPDDPICLFWLSSLTGTVNYIHFWATSSAMQLRVLCGIASLMHCSRI
ncbi:hypothetical protein AAHE18_01G166800 [Arachis hypogaea]